MLIKNLKVIHLPSFGGGEDSHSRSFPFLDPTQVFHLKTCQRSLWAYLDSPTSSQSAPRIGIYSGEAAYRLLLSVACGLESQILGETNIFGQIKEAWELFLALSPNSGLAPIFQKLFEDTKEIRSHYLRHSGGSTYGALVKKVIQSTTSHSAPPLSSSPILILGAGDIAQSVAPWLLENELWLWNRDQKRLASLQDRLLAETQKRGLPQSQVRIVKKGEEAQAFQQAAHLVVCIPFDSEGDPDRVRLWGKKDHSCVVHLSGPRNQAGTWTTLKNFYCLDELFALQEAHGELRKAQILRARKACVDRAKLRTLGPSLSIAHGWEYLPAFC